MSDEEKPSITLTNIEKAYTASKEIGRMGGQLVPTGIKSALATCGKCGAVWTTRRSRPREESKSGNFQEAIGKLRLHCPKCSVRGEIEAVGLLK